MYGEIMNLDAIKKHWIASNPDNPFICVPKEEIYHYTSALAFNSIISNRNFWLTKSEFMNDKSEINYAYNLLIERLEVSNLEPSLKIMLKEKIDKSYINGLFNNIYVLCFSKNPDSLSLWSYYGKNDGYNIGIDPQFIYDLGNDIENIEKVMSSNESGETSFQEVTKGFRVSIVNKRNTSFSRGIKANSVIYQLKDQISIFDTLIAEISKEFEDINFKQSSLKVDLYLDIMVNFIPFMKDSHYQNEEEYRVTIQLHCVENIFQSSKEKLKLDGIENYRIFNGALIPYLILNMNKDDYIKSICLSPFNESELANKGLMALGEVYPTGLKIRKSSIPSRF